MPSTMPVAAKPRAYRRFATSTLHTRFVTCVLFTFIWHFFLQAVTSNFFASRWAFFWALFPVGYAGFKAALFSMTSLLLFFYQISTLDIGSRSNPSRLKSIWESLKLSTCLSFFWYFISAFWFSEVFALTAPASWQLHWTINGGYGAPDKLNERPIYLRSVFILLGIVHAAQHNYYALSLVSLSKRKAKDNILDHIRVTAPLMLHRAVSYSVGTAIVAPFVYHGLLRSFFWKLHIVWAKLFANIPRSESNPPSSLYLGSAIWWGFCLSLALSLTWQLNIILFRFYMLTEPVKNGMVLSTSSKDPNGTLLNGLQAKMPLVKTLAFWELDIIARTSPDRRKNIFADFERPMQEPVFTSMIAAAQTVVRSIQVRISEAENPSSKVPTTTAPVNDPNIQRLPRLLPESTSAKSLIYQDQQNFGNGFVGQVTNAASKEVKKFGSSDNPLSPPTEKLQKLAQEVTPKAIKYIDDFKQKADPYTRRFGVTSTRLIKSAVLGTPIANPDLTLFAISSSTTLLVASLTEDAFGKAVQCVPSTIQCFASTVFAIEAFVKKHSNGGFVSEVDAAELKDVEIIQKQLKAAIAELLAKFQLFLSDVGFSIRDLNETQKATNKDPLFTVIKVSSYADNVQSDNQASKVREMEEPGRRKVSANSRPNTAQVEETDANNTARPGRLFKQLDAGSAYQESLRKRRNSSKRIQNEELNPLAPRSGNLEMTENVLGARDFGMGGLQSRRAGRAA